jgi:hypothetical protein
MLICITHFIDDSFIHLLMTCRTSPLAHLPDAKSHASGLPPLGSLDALPHPHSKRSPVKLTGPISRSPEALSSNELSHDALSAKRLHDHLEDSFDHSLEEKLEESKDGFEISDSFENSDLNLKLNSPLSKQPSHILTPLGDALSPYSTKSEKEEKSYTMDDSQPEELASASFLEESEISESSNMFDDEDCILLDSPKKSDSDPSQVTRVLVPEEDTSEGPATDEHEHEDGADHVNVTVSTASTVHTMRSRAGWSPAEDKEDRPEDDFDHKETGAGAGAGAGADSREKDDSSAEQVAPGRSSDQAQEKQGGEDKDKERKVDDYEVNSDFDSIEDMEEYSEDMKYDEEEQDEGGRVDLNASHTSYRSNQEEDEEENSRINARRDNSNNSDLASGSLFSSPLRTKREETSARARGSPLGGDKNKSMNDTEDYDDEYGDDFDDDFDEEEGEEAAEELEESIAESLEEDFDDDDNLSFGSKHDNSDDDSDKDKSYMSSPSHSPTGKLPSLFTKSKLPEESKHEKSFDDSHDSDPFQDKSASFDEGGPETSLASKDDLEDFSVGAESSGSDEFLKDEDDESASNNDLSVKDQKSVGRLGDSNEFSMSENEISGSHNLNDFGVDYTTSAAPPVSRRGGW